MKVVERVLTMSEGYVLDFSNRTFDEFIGRELGLDATAPRFSVNGGSKANRLRSILHSLPAGQQAKLLRALLGHRDSPAFTGHDRLDDEWRETYLKIITSLEQRVSDADEVYSSEDAVSATSSAWTGRRTIREQVTVVRELAPVALGELDELANLVESKRFNDPETTEAIQCLRDLHRQLGELIEAVDRGYLTRDAVESFEQNRQRLIGYIKDGAKLTVIAPAMTFGIMHLLSWISGVPVDSTLLSTVYGSVVGHDVLKSLTKRSSLAG